MAVPVTFAGKHGKGIAGTGTPVPLLLTEWEVDEKADELDGTTAEDGGFGVSEEGVVQCDITVRGMYYVTQSPVAPFTRNTPIIDLKLYLYKLSSDTGPLWTFPLATLISLRVTSQVRGKIEFVATLKSKGTFSRPAT